MIDYIKRIFQKIIPHSSHESAANVDRDWSIILILSIVAILVIATLNARLFMRINSGELFIIEYSDEEKIANAIDESLLADTLEFFEEKENRFEKLKRNAPYIPDVR